MAITSASVVQYVVQNTGTAVEAAAPVTFGQVFKQGDMPAGAGAELRGDAGLVVPCQLDARTAYPDGSVKHAVLSSVLPSMAAGESKNFTLFRVEPSATGTATAISDFPGVACVVSITQAGTVYTASLAAMLSGQTKNWLLGPIAGEWEVSGPFKTAAGVEHADIHVRFNVRGYKGQNKCRIDVTVENTWAWNPSPKDVTYDVSITVGGAAAYSKTGVVHHPRAGWRKIFWWNGTAPSVHIKHDTPYLIASKAVPNYDLSVVPSASGITNYRNATLTNLENGGPMGWGNALPSMAGTGGRPDIGIMPGWNVVYLLSMSPAAKEAVLNQGDLARSWSMHFRDKNTDRPLSLQNWPHYSLIGTAGDNVNPATGLSEKAPNIVSNTNPCIPDVSHHPDMSYLQYLVTGDIFYAEELLFWAMYCVINQMSHSSYRNGAAGWIKPEQLRGQAWALRTMAHAAYILPVAADRAEVQRILKSNIDWYDAQYTNNTGDKGKLGIISHGYSLNYGMLPGVGVTGLANWQDDHFTAAVGRAVELGFEFARPLFNYKAKYTVARLTEPGTHWQQAAMYAMRVKDNEASPVYTTYLQCYQNTMSPEVLAAVGDGVTATQAMATAWWNYNAWAASQDRQQADGVSNPAVGDMDGYSDSPSGYPSCLQQAIAYCKSLGAPGADTGWARFDGRSIKPSYSVEPQFAIVPRDKESATVAVPEDKYTVASGQTMYFGREGLAPLLAPTIIEELSGTPWAAQNGKIVVVNVHGSSGQPTANGRQFVANVSGKLAFMGDTTFQFSTVAVWDGAEYYLGLRPVDLYTLNGYPNRESAHIGLLDPATNKVRLVSESRYDEMMRWADATLTQYDHVHRILTGGSMGGWGTITYGVRRYDMFAALYADRPRFRYGDTLGFVSVATPANGFQNFAVASAPQLSDEDGGGSFADYVDMIAYVQNTANKVRPILWCCGRNDGFAKFEEQIAMVDALRASGRAFAFAWNNGDHATGSIMNELLRSYPYGTYSRNHGWPLFTEHSRDQDPRSDLVGGINVGLKFDQVVESSSSWSCRVTNIDGPCTVKVKPVSDVFKANVEAKTVTIPSAGTFVTVTFNA